MTPRSRLDLARVLLARAVDDEALVQKVAADSEISDSIIGFHAQQAVEKQIKAVLAARRIKFAKSHALDYLIGLVEQHEIGAPPGLEQASTLSPWAVEFRYEGENPPALNREHALQLVKELRSWAESEINAARCSES